ncbi:hypothetical protein AVEN_180507-1 [Araneus ventricosus]|uniref:Uncharacterized protein n=1 Tax=Araneus ventricosus TaxID=182803 RepID=A0A4Y2SWF6_ARAVE|nr:hypothetical protein AVEN_180507-1 [Araneus ventricosus]
MNSGGFKPGGGLEEEDLNNNNTDFSSVFPSPTMKSIILTRSVFSSLQAVWCASPRGLVITQLFTSDDLLISLNSFHIRIPKRGVSGNTVGKSPPSVFRGGKYFQSVSGKVPQLFQPKDE